MLVSEISLWGAALIAFFVVVASVVLAIVDGRMLRRMLTVFCVTVAQMVVVGAVVWLSYLTCSWWAYLLWFLLVWLLSVCWCLYPLQPKWKRMMLPVGVSMLAGSIVVGGSTVLCLPTGVFMTVYTGMMACLTASMIQTMLNYQRTLHQMEAHKRELSWRESVLPQVRSMAQPLVMVMPMLYAGMLLGGISAFVGIVIILMLIAASFVANVLTGVIALLMARRDCK